VILDVEWLRGRTLESLAGQLIDGGATVIQYRDKKSTTADFYRNALVLRRATLNGKIPLIVNDRLDVALAVQADGIHVGREDLPIEAIRVLAPDMTVGLSVSSLEDFSEMPEPDYYGVGALYSTDTKAVSHVPGLALVRGIRGRTGLPLIGIGGINGTNAGEAILAGCDGVAVISAILGGENAGQAANCLRKIIDQSKAVS
jgi:thiamine-phosphate pyrophosphorylase